MLCVAKDSAGEHRGKERRHRRQQGPQGRATLDHNLLGFDHILKAAWGYS